MKLDQEQWKQLEEAGLRVVQSDTQPDLGWFTMSNRHLWGPFESREAAVFGAADQIMIELKRIGLLNKTPHEIFSQPPEADHVVE